MNNAIRFDKSKIVDGSNYSINTESVDLNSYLAKEKEYLSKMAKALKLSEYTKWEQEFNTLSDRIRNNFYDEKSGYFYDIDAETGEFLNSALGPEGWTPIWCEIATEKQAKEVIKHMMDSTRFNTTVPLPTIDVSHPKFDPKNGYWRGPVWLDQLWFGVDGLHQYGYAKEANLLKIKVINNCEGLNKPGISMEDINIIPNGGFPPIKYKKKTERWRIFSFFENIYMYLIPFSQQKSISKTFLSIYSACSNPTNVV